MAAFPPTLGVLAASFKMVQLKWRVPEALHLLRYKYCAAQSAWRTPPELGGAPIERRRARADNERRGDDLPRSSKKAVTTGEKKKTNMKRCVSINIDRRPLLASQLHMRKWRCGPVRLFFGIDPTACGEPCAPARAARPLPKPKGHPGHAGVGALCLRDGSEKGG
jgi:hypothetical protein